MSCKNDGACASETWHRRPLTKSLKAGVFAPMSRSLKAGVFAPMSSFRPRDGRDATASVACSPPPAPSSCRTSRRKRRRRISCGLAALAFEPRWDRISRFTAEGRMAEVKSALVRSRRRMADSPSDCGWPYPRVPSRCVWNGRAPFPARPELRAPS